MPEVDSIGGGSMGGTVVVTFTAQYVSRAGHMANA
jgi:hypothetical protein